MEVDTDVRGEIICREDCLLLNRHSSTICCVDDVVRLLLDVDESVFCVGNPESKFSQLVDDHKGRFLDRSGKLWSGY